MSQVTTDNRVSSVDLTPQTMRTPVFTTRDVAVALGRGTAASVQAGVQAAVLGAQLVQGAVRVAAPVASAAYHALEAWVRQAGEDEARGPSLTARQMTLGSLSRSGFQASVAQSATAAEALQTIVRSPLRLGSEDVAPIAMKLQALARSDDKHAITAFAGELALRHQAVMQREVATILCESAQAVGFTQITQRPADGYVLARLPGSHMVFRADVTLDGDGQLKVATDTDGFHGTACEETTAKIFAEARKRGLHIQEGGKKSKVRLSQQGRRGLPASGAIRPRHS